MKQWLKIIIAGLILVIIAAAVYIYIARRPASADEAPIPTAPTSQFFNQTSQAVNRAVAQKLATAKVKAKEWKSDAVFMAYSLKVPSDLTAQVATETFSFGSISEGNSWWTISFAPNGNLVRAIMPKTDFLGVNIKPIQENLWQKNYVDALETAEENGGLKFRSQNPDAEISLVLEQALPKNWLWWIVEYRGSNSNLKIRINAFDGRIYDEKGNVIQTNSTSNQNSSSTNPEIK